MADGTPIAKPKIVRGVAKRMHVETMSGSGGAWWTPPDFAAHFVRWARIERGMRVLDLGAGIGNLTLAAIGVGAIVTAVEIDRSLEKQLRARIAGRADVVIADAFDPMLRARCQFGVWDVSIGNFPWELDLETRFMRRGVELAPRVAAIISLDGLVGQKRDEEGWRHLRQTDELRVPGRLSFSQNGATGQEHCVGVQAVARSTPRQDHDVDPVAVSYYRPAKRAGR